MINFMGMGQLLFVSYVLTAIVYFKKKKAIIDHFYLLVGFIYIGAIIDITLFPIPYQQLVDRKFYHSEMECVWNFTPFKTIRLYMDSPVLSQTYLFGLPKHIIGNILLLAPLGLYVPLRKKLTKFSSVILRGLLFSIGIEVVQAMLSYFVRLNYRAVDVDDVILNTFGVGIGYVFYLIYTKVFRPEINDQYNFPLSSRLKWIISSILMVIIVSLGIFQSIQYGMWPSQKGAVTAEVSPAPFNRNVSVIELLTNPEMYVTYEGEVSEKNEKVTITFMFTKDAIVPQNPPLLQAKVYLWSNDNLLGTYTKPLFSTYDEYAKPKTLEFSEPGKSITRYQVFYERSGSSN
jgi:glycopeptide antibiotics resistance protein